MAHRGSFPVAFGFLDRAAVDVVCAYVLRSSTPDPTLDDELSCRGSGTLLHARLDYAGGTAAGEVCWCADQALL